MVHNRTVEARRFRAIGSDLLMQLRRAPTADRLLINQAATLAMLREQATADMIEGQPYDQENYRRNATLLGSTLIKMGMVIKSRDVRAGDRAGRDAFGDALIEANAAG
jgi:hypothetical protein